ncbi:hypothetical protein DIQ79_02445 [Mycolicibacterium smegmatis]|nr:hypothetical protein EYS45_13130 [Mycolicibacterium smegmatis MC2 155]TBM51212.1 hypothetical protein DIQ86_05920 [Mycolicibacterium smegmatis]TBM56335.1 hypothetical protein DIQ85_02445 [Mycolicibacterium smegmatis]TBM67297.1 hypothetical protein DIQ83_02445 [Mycolicibacterium smegmatis]TBM75686.1 hypothetical protein DIQ82_01935 [Mycolicibacterium smegmatis]
MRFGVVGFKIGPFGAHTVPSQVATTAFADLASDHPVEGLPGFPDAAPECRPGRRGRTGLRGGPEALHLGHVMTSTPVAGRFVMPDGLVSLDTSRSREKIVVGEDPRQRRGSRRGSDPPPA